MATAKQLAALKKARAARKKNIAKKKPAKKVTVKKAAPKRKKVASKRKRSVGGYILGVVKSGKVRGYWDGRYWDDEKGKAMVYTLAHAKQEAKSIKIPAGYGIAAISVKK